MGGSVFALVCTLSYTLQRLHAAWGGEVDATAVFASAHIPLFGRLALAVLHGVVVGVVLAMAVREPEWWLQRVPWAVLAVVVPCAIAMAVVP